MYEKLKVRPLNREEIEEVYREYMPEAFPAAEVKPLTVILDLVAKGTYWCYGLFDEDIFVGYGFFFRAGDNCQLLDYFAILPQIRSKGYGSAFLKIFFQKYPDMITLGEMESPRSAHNEGEKALRERRIRFYQRNGYALTPVYSVVFGVEYRIMIQNGPVDITTEQIAQLLLKIYGELFPYPPEKIDQFLRVYTAPPEQEE